MNTNLITPQIAYFLALLGAFITAISQIILKLKARNSIKDKFLKKFFNVRVISAYTLLVLVLAINQIALIYVPISVMPCITATSFIWVFILSKAILKENFSKRKVMGTLIIILGLIVSRF